MQRSPDAARMWRLASRYSAVGIEIAVAVALGTSLGVYLDDRWQLQPWGLLLGFVVGCAAAALTVLRLLRRTRL